MLLNDKNRNIPPKKFLWMDLEMTGLDTEKHVIIEVAAEVTDADFKTLATYEALVKQSPEKLAAADEWPKKQHAANGLFDRLQEDGIDEKDVVNQLVGFIKAQFGNMPAILAGNSIHNDRRFISAYWPEVEELLHYRMLDVSSFKVLMQAKYGTDFKKKGLHRALDDIQASIAELQHYLDVLKNSE